MSKEDKKEPKKDQKSETALEMFVGGLVLDPNTQAPVVILKDESGEVTLPIWIGIAEATSIASAIKQLSMQRPLTHDLMYDIFLDLGIKVQRVMITELKEATYYAELVLALGDRVIIFDSRPSDAIAIAVRAAAPIYVAQQVLDQAKVVLPAGPGAGEPTGDGAPSESGAQNPAGDTPEAPEGQAENALESPLGPTNQDFTSIDKERWNEILDSLDADDFKYKM
jgi:bifunctional DNase/RNase